MKPTVIAFLGRAGSGKTTAAQHLVETFGAKRISFATPLKKLAAHVFKFTDEQLYGSTEAKEKIDPRYGVSPREFLIRLGDGARRFLGPRVWVDAAFSEIMSVGPANALFVIDDLRYPSEAVDVVTCKHFKGAVIKLVCPDSDSSGFADSPSESSVDNVPNHLLRAIITSKKSPGSSDLKTKVSAVVNALLQE